MSGVILCKYHFEGEEIQLSRSSSSTRDVDFESGRGISNAETTAGVLQDIAMKCGTKVIGKRFIVRNMLMLIIFF